jgi:hypothetical protein
MKNVIPVPYQERGKLQPESSFSETFWMPPYQGTGQAPQVRHDGIMKFMDRHYTTQTLDLISPF